MPAAIRAMVAGAVQDRLAALVAVVVALLFLLTAWVLGIAALVLLLAGPLGAAGALASVTVGLVVLALATVALTRGHNRRTADARASTRALWAATAVNAAASLLRRGPEGQPDKPQAEEGGGSHRSALLIGGGLALIILGVLFPSGPDTPADAGETDTEPEPDGAA